MIPLKTALDIDAIGRAGRIIAALFQELPERIAPGVTTDELDRFCDGFVRGHDGALPSFKGLYGFPRSACISVNEEVVHGIPSPGRALVAGDLVTVDVGVELDGWFGDAARTYPVAEVSDDGRRLLDATRAALNAGVEQAVIGNRLGDVGHAIQAVAEHAGLSVVRELVGHGIGRRPHEEPNVPNYGQPGRGLKLREGMVLAIEPMLNLGGPDVETLDDDWTVVTADRKPSAHFEQTVAITAEGPKVLTSLNGNRL
ncbi:MAG TPA: type I methionyl aminopeptidase [Longimicrobiales bacterium]|nr:type I methionyl aminopeptidase [Longimicrobiales bacterium]